MRKDAARGSFHGLFRLDKSVYFVEKKLFGGGFVFGVAVCVSSKELFMIELIILQFLYGYCRWLC